MSLGSIVLVESVADAEQFEVEDPHRVAYITQTTLSVDEAREIVSVLQRRFPSLYGPEKEDICYATTNRQRAVKELLEHVQVLLVLGSPNSSNSQRLIEVARAACVPAHLIESERELDEASLEHVETVGVTSGASAPDVLVEGLSEWFRARGVTEIREFSPARRTSSSGSRPSCVGDRPLNQPRSAKVQARFATNINTVTGGIATT